MTEIQTHIINTSVGPGWPSVSFELVSPFVGSYYFVEIVNPNQPWLAVCWFRAAVSFEWQLLFCNKIIDTSPYSLL
jgi:hypothetical protein